LGFPQHHDGADVSIHEGHLVHEYKFEGMRRFHISPTVIQGNSGGPVLNSRNQVVGVAIKGGPGELNAVVPISYLFHLVKAVSSI
jgi:S1-C subfamily serine protease